MKFQILKKLTTVLLLAVCFTSVVSAQEVDLTVIDQIAKPSVQIDTTKPRYWKYGGLYSLTTTQTGYYHWADGGENSLALNAFANFASTYQKKRFLFDNYINLAYGIAMYANDDIKLTDVKKTDDKIDLALTTSFQMNKNKANWYYSAMFTLLSQFADGYDYANPITDNEGNTIYVDKDNLRKKYPLKSTLFSPATMNLSLGASYVYKDRLTLILSPISGKLVVVADDRLTHEAYYDADSIFHPAVAIAGVQAGKHTKWGAGFLGEIRWKRPLNKAKTVGIDSKLRVSNNYLDENKDNRWNFDVYGLATLNFTISKVMTASIRLEFAYDDEIKFKRKDGSLTPTGQFKEIIGIGLAWKLEQAEK